MHSTQNRINWESLVEIEPGLVPLVAAARSLKPNDWRGWERDIKGPLRWLVGFNAHRPELRSLAAWDTAYRYLLRVWEVRR